MGELDEWVSDWKSGGDPAVTAEILRKVQRGTWSVRASMATIAVLLLGVMAFFVALTIRTPKPSLVAFTAAMGVFCGVWGSRIWIESRSGLAAPTGGAKDHLALLRRRTENAERVLAFSEKALWAVPVIYLGLLGGAAVEKVLAGLAIPVGALLLNAAAFFAIHVAVVVSYRVLRRRSRAKLARIEELERLAAGSLPGVAVGGDASA